MKTVPASILFALVTSVVVNCIPIRSEIQELSSRAQVIGLEARELTTRGDDAIAGRAPSYQHRRDDITVIETRVATTGDKRAADPLQAGAESSDEADKRTLTISTTNSTDPDNSLYRGQPVDKREAEAKVVEPNCFASASSDDDDAGCVVNLRA